jgi:hypothetical protein
MLCLGTGSYWFFHTLDASTIKNGKILGHIAVPVYKCNLTNVDLTVDNGMRYIKALFISHINQHFG